MGNMKHRPETTWRARFANWVTDACGRFPARLATRRASAPALALAGLLACGHAVADPGYYLVTVYENEGLATLDFRYWTVKNRGAGEVVWPEIGIGYGVTKRWYTELLASYIGSATMATHPSNLQWQNDFLLTQGQYDVDVALHTLLIRNYDRSGSHALEFGPVLQTELGRMRFNANLIFESSWGLPAPKPTQLKYQWQAKYRWKPGFQFGLQGFGEVGEWDRWAPSSRQSHRLGPVVTGTLPLGRPEGLQYQFAYLDGKIYARRGHMLSLRLQYAF